MKENNIIIWQKWQDPFGEKDDNIDLDDEYTNFFDSENESYESEGEEDREKEYVKDITQNKQIKVIATPMGIVPINDNTASGKIFNFWVGHTNFNLTKNITKIIEEIRGIETLDIFTRYRFRIAIGKAFNESTVKQDLQNRVYSYMDEYDKEN